jgi:hypothetical protein
MASKRPSYNLKKYSYESLPIFCLHTIPIKKVHPANAGVNGDWGFEKVVATEVQFPFDFGKYKREGDRPWRRPAICIMLWGWCATSI